jgi:hypothetical protein
MKTSIHFCLYLAQFFLEWEKLSENSCRENQNTYFMFNNYFGYRAIYEMKWKNICTAGQATDDNMAHVHCTLRLQTHTQNM